MTLASAAMPSRAAALGDFLAANAWGSAPLAKLAGDASFRRYYRLTEGTRSAVLMDAPPPQENVRAYVQVAGIVRGFGLSAPEIYAADLDRGFLLIEDFGDDTYTHLLGGGADETALYTLAVDALIALQHAVAESGVPDVPPYEEARFLTEAGLLVDWYAPEALGAPLSADAREEYLGLWRQVLPEATLPGPTLVLRDYHVDNLMLLPGRTGIRGCGLLDFQDALRGPAAYDLVSLLKDARRDVSPALREAMTERYLAAFPTIDPCGFLRSAAILAVQRNCKIVGLFVRLWRRDGKPQYLPHIARVWRLIEEDLREPALLLIARWLDRHLPRGLRRTPAAERAA